MPRYVILTVLGYVFSALGLLAALFAAFNAARMVLDLTSAHPYADTPYWLGVYLGALVGALFLLAVGEFLRMAVAVADRLAA